MRGLPEQLARAQPAVVRPRDLKDEWAMPRKELHHLARGGTLLRLAHGYYAVVPESARGRQWKPGVEAAGMAIAQTDYGVDAVAVMGPSAARLLGHVPRALGAATIATSAQRPSLDTVSGHVRFVTRNVPNLDVQRVETELGPGWVTTAEQTLLDIVDRPTLAGFTHVDASEAVRSLASVSDLDFVLELANDQHKRRAHDAIVGARGTQDWPRAVGAQ